MSDVQIVLEALEDALHNGTVSEDMCHGLKLALDGVPAVYHMDAFKKMLGVNADA